MVEGKGIRSWEGWWELQGKEEREGREAGTVSFTTPAESSVELSSRAFIFSSASPSRSLSEVVSARLIYFAPK